VLGTLRNALKIGELRRRILFTIGMFIVFRIGALIPVPGVNTAVIEQFFQQGNLIGMLNVFSGGALSRFSLFAMSIMPYINASIIMQLLTIVVPKFEQWAKEGVEGRKKLTQYTRYGTVVLALIQATGMAFWMRNMNALVDPGLDSIAVIVIVLTAGTAFLMWLGEQITDKGIGNGISLIIFAGIVSGLPQGAVNMVSLLRAGALNIFTVLILGVVALAVIAAIVWIQEGQRRIPVQYSKRVVGRRIYGGQSTHIPMRVNQAGVIPVIFAQSILLFPATIAQFIQHPWAQAVVDFFQAGGTVYNVSYFLLVVVFTYFYTAVTFNPADVANNLKKYGGFIPGIRPGKPTTQYLDRVLVRITLVGAIFLATIAVMPQIFQAIFDIPNLWFGGTGLLIVVGVALETMKQIEAHLLMRHYQGFMRR